jgi:hypothetical protein
VDGRDKPGHDGRENFVSNILTSVTLTVTSPLSLPGEGHRSGGGPEGGAGAVPASGFANRSRAALGISHAGITTGEGGAVPGLGQVSAGNARRIRVPGSMAWS